MCISSRVCINTGILRVCSGSYAFLPFIGWINWITSIMSGWFMAASTKRPSLGIYSSVNVCFIRVKYSYALRCSESIYGIKLCRASRVIYNVAGNTARCSCNFINCFKGMFSTVTSSNKFLRFISFRFFRWRVFSWRICSTSKKFIYKI